MGEEIPHYISYRLFINAAKGLIIIMNLTGQWNLNMLLDGGYLNK